MRIFKTIIMSIGIAAAAMTASAQDEDFRLKWAENDGKSWKCVSEGGSKLCSLVSDNGYADSVYAKLCVMNNQREVMLFLSNIDNSEVVGCLLDTDTKSKDFFVDKGNMFVKYADFKGEQNAMHGIIGNAVDKATCIILKDCAGTISVAKLIKIRLYFGDELFEFRFSPAKPILSL